jgi:hypothetical protein
MGRIFYLFYNYRMFLSIKNSLTILYPLFFSIKFFSMNIKSECEPANQVDFHGNGYEIKVLHKTIN